MRLCVCGWFGYGCHIVKQRAGFSVMYGILADDGGNFILNI